MRFLKRKTARRFVRASAITTASAAAVVIGVAAGRALAAGNALEDIQIGERGDRLRVAVVCRDGCEVEPVTATAFDLVDIEEAFDIPLDDRSVLAERLVLSPLDGASRVSLVAKADVLSSDVNDCRVGDRAATCLDVTFAPPPAASVDLLETAAQPSSEQATRLASAAIPVRAPSTKPSAAGSTKAASEAAAGAPDAATAQVPSAAPASSTAASSTSSSSPAASAAAGDALPPRPQLRDRSNADVLSFTRFASADVAADRVATDRLAADRLAATKAAAGGPPPLRDSADLAAPAPAGEPVDVSARAARDPADGAPLGGDPSDGEPSDAEAPRATRLAAPATPVAPSLRRQTETPGKVAAAPDIPVLGSLTVAPAPGDGDVIVIPDPVDDPFATEDVAAAAARLLDLSLDAASCADAQKSLSDDAWNLDAMAVVAFCRAADGDLSDAEAMFSRLLAYTPDNYKALVGRGLIARAAGEKSVARKFLEDALDAVPPMKESRRIAETLRAL
ncbi:MAG: hypothetical protein AAGC56_13215 [Pseudomonadota bacterium]